MDWLFQTMTHTLMSMKIGLNWFAELASMTTIQIRHIHLCLWKLVIQNWHQTLMLIMSSKVWFRSSLTFLIFIFSVSRSSSTWKSINNQSINRQLMSRSFSTWALNMIVILRLSKDSSDHWIVRSSDVLNPMLWIKGSYDNMPCIIWSNQLIIWSEVTFEWSNHNVTWSILTFSLWMFISAFSPLVASLHWCYEMQSYKITHFYTEICLTTWLGGNKFGWRDQHFFCRGSKNLGIKTLTSQCVPSLQSWPLLTFHCQTCSRLLSASEAAPGSQTENTDDQVLMIRPISL